MAIKAFLLCALALPAVHFNDKDRLVSEIKQIKDFLNNVHPGAEVKIVPEEQRPVDPHWERVPLTWRGYTIWIRRRHVYDRHLRISG